MDHEWARDLAHYVVQKGEKNIDDRTLPIAKAYLAQDAELQALRRVRDVAEKGFTCDATSAGECYCDELRDALAAARGSEKPPAGSTTCGHVLKEPGCMQCALHPPEVP